MLHEKIDYFTQNELFSYAQCVRGITMVKKPLLRDKKIIEKLGGPAKVAGILSFKVQRVQNWMTRGIPASIKLEYPHLFLNQNLQNNIQSTVQDFS